MPGLFGVGNLAALAEGAEVTVDATGCAVYPGRIQELLDEAVRRQSVMVGSPVDTAAARTRRRAKASRLLRSAADAPPQPDRAR